MGAGLVACGMVFGVALVLEGERRGSRTLALVGKPLASALFVWLGFTRWSAGDPVGGWMVAALVLCALGDVLLIDDRTFDAGLVAFLLGHLAFVYAFHSATSVTRWPVAVALPLLAVAAVIARWLWPRLGARRGPVLAYIAAITLMVWGAAGVAAAGTRPPKVALGAALFFLSDLLVARERFVSRALVNRVAGLPTYYAAQFLLGLCVGRAG